MVWTASTLPIRIKTLRLSACNLTYDEAMQRNIRVLDQTAFSLCRDNNVTMRVFGMQGEGNVTRAILGEKMGTLVTR